MARTDRGERVVHSKAAGFGFIDGVFRTRHVCAELRRQNERAKRLSPPRGAVRWPIVVTLLHAIRAVWVGEMQHTRCAGRGDDGCSVNDWKRVGATAA